MCRPRTTTIPLFWATALVFLPYQSFGGSLHIQKVYLELFDVERKEQGRGNGKFYDHNRIDTTVQLGGVERWTIKNKAEACR